ncbi:MAG: AAA family ATPase [Candidatus Micrarchaeota archaeon]|nr:AAA family ATPase [Candidatus Micrarchaeota archaeon]
MANIFSLLESKANIFRNEAALLPDFLPSELPGREKELKSLAYCLLPASQNRQPQHALLFGPPGTGKTSVAKFVLEQLKAYTSRACPIYINCWEYSTRSSVFSAIADALGELLPRRGIAADEIFSRIIEIAKKQDKVLVLVLDEIDRLGSSHEGVQVLYDLCRASESYGVKTGIIAITNDELFHMRLDGRIRSSFVQNTFKFLPYTVSQLKEILASRAKIAFDPLALEADVIGLCAAIAFKKGGDARIALSLLHKAGKEAEAEGASKVLTKHVRQAEQKADYSNAKSVRKFGQLDEIDQQIVQAAKDGILSGQLYQKLSWLARPRSLRARIERLARLGILTVEERQIGKGKSRLIKSA